jgi:putative membrane protein insertion efficiency factor
MVISPALGAFFGPAGGCRFTPTCSVYAADAVREHGAVRGSWLATKRLCRCHPWGGHGHDPIPENKFSITGTSVAPLDAVLLGRQVVQAEKAVTSHRTPYSKAQPFAASSSTVI